MHAFHSLAHRAPPATRTRVRWQPYASIPTPSCSSSSSRSSPASSYLHTPSSSVPSSPQITTPSHEIDRIRQILPTPPNPKDSPSRDSQRNKHAISLVDQAVKSLCEIWRPQDIPPVFVVSARSMVAGDHSFDQCSLINQKPPLQTRNRNTQLPSPVSPSTHPSPLSASNSSPSAIAEQFISPEQENTSTLGTRSNLVPIKAFVHEVLRRSRTSGCVLQTALCYLEAIRSKIPQLARQEQSGEGVKGEPDISDAIVIATEAEIEREREIEFAMSLDPPVNNICTGRQDDDGMATVRVRDDGLDTDITNSFFDSEIGAIQTVQKPTFSTLPPLPPLPSPLLCPRRAFLASLILASKFTQDKCYSNRAWAKLSGLPPREIGRCERALGEALDWRLWVGKQLSTQSQASPVLGPTRAVVRSQSENSLFASAPSAFLPQDDKSEPLSLSSQPPRNRGLRRCKTLPTESYATVSVMAQAEDVPWRPSLCSPEQMTETEPPKAIDFCPSTSGYAQYLHNSTQSPSPRTPGLTYSPSSTESCSGDHTIQMSSFPDDLMGTCISGHLGTNHSESWPWLDGSDIATLPPRTPSPFDSAALQSNLVTDRFGPIPAIAGYGDSLPTKLPPSDLQDVLLCPQWVAENIIPLYPLRW